MFITTEEKLATDTFNTDGSLKSIAEYFHCELSDGVKFVEDGADLSKITHKKVTSTPALVLQLNDVCRQYLSDTDWYVARKSEVNKDIPEHITTLRATMRKLIT
tara:strand:- start:155 stop:466 length:312 start_codon:yes stop_codon:yes gene_type:complete